MIRFDSRLEMLYEIPQGGDCCEVGVFAGDFSRAIAGICDPARLVLVDAFASWSFSCDENGANPRTLSGDCLLSEARSLAKARPGVEVYSGLSSQVLPTLADHSLDFIYLDADHSYEGVKNDLAQAWRLVRYGGFIAGHDYSLNAEKCVDASHYKNFGVKQAVDEFLDEHDLMLYGIAMDGYTSFVIKK